MELGTKLRQINLNMIVLATMSRFNDELLVFEIESTPTEVSKEKRLHQCCQKAPIPIQESHIIYQDALRLIQISANSNEVVMHELDRALVSS